MIPSFRSTECLVSSPYFPYTRSSFEEPAFYSRCSEPLSGLARLFVMSFNYGLGKPFTSSKDYPLFHIKNFFLLMDSCFLLRKLDSIREMTKNLIGITKGIVSLLFRTLTGSSCSFAFIAIILWRIVTARRTC